MKKSNSALLSLSILFLGGLVATNFVLKGEAAEIDLTDPLRNYDSERIAPFRVLKISGSNGYPIEIEQAEANSLTYLRRRKGFLETKALGDTLEIIFSGANIPLDQSDKSTTPAGVIIKTKALAHIHVKDTFTRIKGFRSNNLNLHLTGNSANDFLNCRFSTLSVQAKNNSRFQFKNQNMIDTVSITLKNNTIGFLRNITFSHLQHQVGDSAMVVLTNQSLKQMARSRTKEGAE